MRHVVTACECLDRDSCVVVDRGVGGAEGYKGSDRKQKA
jgi:hypothetical protein